MCLGVLVKVLNAAGGVRYFVELLGNKREWPACRHAGSADYVRLGVQICTGLAPWTQLQCLICPISLGGCLPGSGGTLSR